MILLQIRRATVTVIAILMLVIAALVHPTHAAAAEAVAPSYEGWAYVNANACQPNTRCIMIYRYETPTWEWTGRVWRQDSIGDGTRVYAAPYVGRWHWIWTQYTGWRAIPTYKIRTLEPLVW